MRVERSNIRLCASLLLCLFVLSMCVSIPLRTREQEVDERIQSKETELRELRKRIAEQRKKIQEVEKKEKNELEYLRRLEKEEKLTRKLMAGLGEKEGMYQEQADRLRLDLSSNEIVYNQRLDVFSKRTDLTNFSFVLSLSFTVFIKPTFEIYFNIFHFVSPINLIPYGNDMGMDYFI